MLTYKDILFATTKLLSGSLDVDVIVDDSEGIFDKECFYVSIIPNTIAAATRTTDIKNIIISIKYFGGDKLSCYDYANSLNNLFNRNLKVKDMYLTVSNTEPNIFKDEVGCVLDFLIYITYHDLIEMNEEELEKIQEIEINYKN